MPKIRSAIKSVLIIDIIDHENNNLISIFLEHGIDLDIVSYHDNYKYMMDSKQYDCIMLNSDMKDNLTEKIIDYIKVTYPGTIVVVLLENPSYEKVFQFIRISVDDFIMKPYTWDDIEKLLRFYYF